MADVKRKPTRNARQYADRIARTSQSADSTEPPRTLTPNGKKKSARHSYQLHTERTPHNRADPL